MPVFAELVNATKAIADPTRLRILVVLQRHELTVTELCVVLDQSQPRVSRHLKLLVDAQLLERHAQGAHAFYRLADTAVAKALAPSVASLVEPADPVIERDTRRLDGVRRNREAQANDYFEQVAEQWDEMRSLHVADELVEQALLAAAPTGPGLRLLDLGTGTGRMLELFADRIEGGVGIDLSREMLHLARTRIEQQGYRHLRVRHGSITDLDVAPHSHDITILHHVLHFLDDPASVVEQAAWATVEGGALVIVDFAPHSVETLRTQHAHRRLGISEAEVA
ncbi:MAG: metalloregulator ArsR/SmtB family transcription factor, partial [Actinomycetota bacterium]|nr:metalloregulator ArsR/SmtB family transcription factor [Actinomycetota bacterium]